MDFKAATVSKSRREFRGSVPDAQPAVLRTLCLAALGSSLELYDFVIFAFFTAVIGRLFFAADFADWVRQLQTFGIFAVGYFARPLGGMVMAHFGDVRGRKQIFRLSVLTMAIPTLLIGFLPTYQSIGLAAPLLLLAMRIVQGMRSGARRQVHGYSRQSMRPARASRFCGWDADGGLEFRNPARFVGGPLHQLCI